MYSYVPFILLAVINICLVVDLHKRSKGIIDAANSRFKKSQLSINISVIIMTILFIVFTCASAVASHYYDQLVQSFNGNIILFSADSFAFTYHSLNILIVLFSNKQFRIKFKETFGLKVNTASQTASTGTGLKAPTGRTSQPRSPTVLEVFTLRHLSLI